VGPCTSSSPAARVEGATSKHLEARDDCRCSMPHQPLDQSARGQRFKKRRKPTAHGIVKPEDHTSRSKGRDRLAVHQRKKEAAAWGRVQGKKKKKGFERGEGKLFLKGNENNPLIHPQGNLYIANEGKGDINRVAEAG